ncbi:MAG: DeoR/GlpR transcriptional regulator [Hyphomicrobiaceae bacterium]|nr:DeoR/GlpR transcriptional regulator [Hyphomicrobiaceae bacterium]MCC0023796.1 DeoR/GlpR transcriptional regulator [Hyphomicrobiaceae bacterium]
MHENERHRIILATVQARPVASVTDLVEITGASEATIRRDIAALHMQGALRRIRGGAEAVNPPRQSALAGQPFSIKESINMPAKRAIGRAAAEMCIDGEQIIINGGSTTYQMVPHLTSKRMSVFTNSFPIAEHLLHNSRNNVVIPGGTVYREQNVILSPFGGIVASHFYARKMFTSCQALGPHGVMEADSLVVQSELALIGQADRLIVLADSSKFQSRTSLILCPLNQVDTVITDSGIRPEDRDMLEAADIKVIVVETSLDANQRSASVA